MLVGLVSRLGVATLAVGFVGGCETEMVEDVAAALDSGSTGMLPNGGRPDMGVDTGVTYSALIIVTASLPDGAEGVDYVATVEAEGGTAEDYRWSIAAGGLAPGTFLRTEGTPDTTISGRPTAPGVAAFTLRVRDSTGNEATRDLSFNVTARGPELQILTTTLPMAPQGSFYEAELQASGGTERGYQWRIGSGQFPPGLVLAEDGTPTTTISGMPTAPGRYSFTVFVSDDGGERAAQFFSVDVTD